MLKVIFYIGRLLFSSLISLPGYLRKQPSITQKVILGLSGLQGKARPFTPGQTGLQIILCLGKTTISQDQSPAIQ
jgi:hypothetical protein